MAKQSGGDTGMADWVDTVVSVITNDGRNLVGTLRGYDQATNLVLAETHERVYSTKQGVEQVPLGLYFVRGDNVAMVGEMDEDLDNAQELLSLRAEPLKPIKT
ncbi:N-alpha-acetyltransferase 38, NatC auxiliary subunit-like protein [Haematococcus lacustris]